MLDMRRLGRSWEIYRIAGNFRGIKLSRKCENRRFRGENFRGSTVGWDACAREYKFTEKTFTNGSKSAKFAKVLSLESFPLYGITSVHCASLVLRLTPLAIILNFDSLALKLRGSKVKGQIIKPRNASIHRGREPGNEAGCTAHNHRGNCLFTK